MSSPQAVSAALVDALGAVDVAALLLRLHDSDERSLINIVKAIAPVVQAKGVALLIEDHHDIVARGGADGAHLGGPDALTAALPHLRPNYIAGAGRLYSRHDAMVAGEAGADYVLFGEPDPNGHRPSFEAVTDRVAWWAEVFEVPCVAYAAALDEIEPLVAAGADFIAVGPAIFEGRDGPGIALAAAARLAVRAVAQ